MIRVSSRWTNDLLTINDIVHWRLPEVKWHLTMMRDDGPDSKN